MKDVVFGGRMLLSVLLAVIAQAALAEKTNTEPIYTITVPGTFSNTFDTITGDLPAGVSFTKTVGGVTTDCTYGDFIDEKEAGTLVKDGEGWLVIDKALSNWSGQIHVDKGVLHVCVAEGGLGKVLCPVGLLPADGDATYVAKGATLLMDSSGMDRQQRAEQKKIVFEGDGAEGMKGSFVVYQKGDVTGGTSGNQSWWFGTLPTLSGDATLASDTSKMRAMFFVDPKPSLFDLGGHTLRIVRGGTGSVDFNQNNSIVTNGQIVADNVKYHMQNGSVAFAAGAESSLTLTNKAYLSLEGTTKVPGPANWTLNVDCPSYVQYMGTGGGYGIALTNAYGWYGPVVLNHSLGIETGVNGYGGTFGGVVSGPGGFFSKGGKSPFLLHLLNPQNTFMGGVKLSDMSLALYADGALPASGGSLALTNGCLYLASLLSDYDDKGRTCSRYQTSYTLPGANFDGTGVVRVVSGKADDYSRVLTPGSPGRWTGPVVKTGAGELDYDASMGGDELDIRQGGVKLHFAGAGLIKSRVRYPDDAADAVVKAFYDSSEILTNEVTLTPDMAYGRGAEGGWTKKSAGVYEGWIWNREATNVNWTFAAAVNNGVKVFFDGTSIISAGNRGAKKTVEVTPGPHHLVLRMYTTCTVGPVIENYATSACSKSWPANVGFLWDPLGRGLEDGKNDYIRLEDPGDGSILSLATDGTPAGCGLVPQFTNITICAGAYLDLNGNGTYEVENLAVSGGEIRNSNAFFTNLTVRVGKSLALSGTPAEDGALLSVSGRLQLGGGTDVTVDTTDLPKKNFTLVSAADGIAGFPDEVEFTGDRAARYGVRPSVDGKSMTCVYTAPGAVIILR